MKALLLIVILVTACRQPQKQDQELPQQTMINLKNSTTTVTVFDMPDPRAYPLTSPDYCFEFDHHTTRNGLKQVCRMMWCGGVSGGLSTLWCERDFNDTAKH